MNQLEHHAVISALRSADFSHSPGLRCRLRRRLLREPGFTAYALAAAMLWIGFLWTIFGG